MPVFAQVSDLHLDGSARNTARARRAIDHVHGLPGPVDAILVTGDIADNGTIPEYEIARSVLETTLPLIMCPGNHDDRAGLRKIMLEADGSDEPVDQVLDLPGLSIALLDTSVPGKPHGYLADSTLGWLDATLSERADTYVLVGMHHHAAPVGIPYVDEIALHSPERLAAVLSRHTNVPAIIAGHVHSPVATTFAGLPLLVGPATVNTALLPQETNDRRPLDWDLPPAVALHVWDGSRLTTHVRPVP